MKKSAIKKLTLLLSPLFAMLLFTVLSRTPVRAQGEVLGDVTSMSDSQLKLLYAKPAVVQITNIITGKIVIQASLASQLGAPSITGSYYDFTLGFGGSGFFITPDGYLVTNGHVAKPTDDLIAYYAISQLAETIWKDAIIFAYQAAYGENPTQDYVDESFQNALDQLYGGDIYQMIDDIYYTNYKGGDLEMDEVTKNNYIQLGAVSGSEKTVKDLGKAATLIDTSYEGEFDSKDIALLKVEGSNFPTVELGSFNNVQLGSEVYVIGYPAIVESGTGIFTDVESGLEPSITKGIISAKKKLVDGTEAFQTDAAVTHGNSGGPALDANGNVIGIATWSFGDEPGGESFNFLISVDQLNRLLSKNNITPTASLSSQKWKEALDLYSDSCFTKAKTKFEEAKTLYPDNVDLDDFITKCQSGIDNGEDKCVTSVTSTLIIVGVVCACLAAVVVVGGIVFFVVIKKKRKAVATASPQTATPTPVKSEVASETKVKK